MSGASSGGMSAEDVEICRAAVLTLTSEKYKGSNDLFLYPFDMSQTPGYMDVVQKVMDLGTLSKNLEAGLYPDRQAFFQDAAVIFENAIAYHSTRGETKWIVKPAKDMLKVVQREKKSADKKASGGGLTTTGMKLPTKKNKMAASAAAPDGSKKEVGGTKLKLKIGNAAVSSNKPKVSIKLKPSGGKESTQQIASQDPGKQPPADKKKKGLKLTLKLGKSKTADETISPGPSRSTTPTPGGSKAPPSSGSGNPGKISIKMPAGPRGKELPKGVVAPPKPATKKSTGKGKAAGKKPAAKTTTKVKKDKPLSKEVRTAAETKAVASATKSSKDSGGKSTPKSSILTETRTSKAGSNKSKSGSKTIASSSSTTALYRCNMTPRRKAQCAKVLSGLRRRKQKRVSWFLHPVSDKGIIQDYRRKIKNPMDLNNMQSKLEKDEYATVADFVLDLRRIFANCLQFNTSIKDNLRKIAVECLTTAEELMTVFLARPEHPTLAYPPQLFCWSYCLSILDTLYNLTNPSDGLATVLYFLHPVSFYYGGHFPPDYLQIVSKPMDFGTVTKNLIECEYTSLEQFAADCRLVIENCTAYYGAQDDGKVFTEQATRLKEVLKQQLDALSKYLYSPPGELLKSRAAASVTTLTLPKPPIPLLLGTLEEMRQLNYTDKATKITEPAMAPFEKPVSLTVYPDYMQYVQSPMDLQTAERKVKSGSYVTPEDFEYDILLTFNNCIVYNSARKSDHLVAMGKYGIKQFKKIFVAKMRPLDDPTGAASPRDMGVSTDPQRKTPPSTMGQGTAKKIKLELSGSPPSSKSAPRISLSAAQLPASTDKGAQATTPRSRPMSSAKPKEIGAKSNQPVPLHIAIARVKEAFPLRRALKSLQPWEANCARCFKELMRHSWISAARPKFIFHVPVPVLFPELREAYAMKIRTPMDLTTVECALLAGNRYAVPEDFIHDVALVFANAIVFNRDGRDVGDPLSCAYYDASIHLLRYTRWLSLELLAEYVEESDHVDEPEEEGMPTLSWRLTAGNRRKAREEMEAIVLKEPIEKSLEGDRYTWMEAECEKLLKALRHQSDVKYMQFFIQPNYPPDYAAFISKPMDWERCQRSLKKRQYDKFGDIIEDLRLIFSNAIKYNARYEGTDSDSGRAFEGANYMSAKLETAVNKMMISVSDRLERERIDHKNAEREIEAAERAEEERIRAQWKSESNKEGGNDFGTAPTRITATLKVRTAKLQNLRRESTDFEIPFFDDEDDGQHERSYFEVVKQQKAIFERQRQELSKMQQTAVSVGSGVFRRMMAHDLAVKWATEEAKKRQRELQEEHLKSKDPESKQNDPYAKANESGPSSVLAKLEEAGRGPLQIKLAKPKLKGGKKRRRPHFSLE